MHDPVPFESIYVHVNAHFRSYPKMQNVNTQYLYQILNVITVQYTLRVMRRHRKIRKIVTNDEDILGT